MATKTAPTELERQLSMQGAPGWNPSPGETIVGTVVSLSASNPGEYGIYPILTVAKGDDTLVSVHCFHSVLKNRLLEKRPQTGEIIAIQYQGERESKSSGRSYHAYSMVVDRPDANTPEVNWDQFDTDTVTPELDEG